MSKRVTTIKRVSIPIAPLGKGRALTFSVPVSNARKSVTINGSAIHALKAERGVTVGCAISNVAVANPDAFPHPVILAHVTRSRVFIVDKIDRAGHPAHAVRYDHTYQRITDANDKGTLKALVAANPQAMERPFLLRVPRTTIKPRGPHTTKRAHREVSPEHRGVTRGALRRAVIAGMISEQAGKQLATAATETE